MPDNKPDQFLVDTVEEHYRDIIHGYVGLLSSSAEDAIEDCKKEIEDCSKTYKVPISNKTFEMLGILSSVMTLLDGIHFELFEDHECDEEDE